MKVHRYAPTEGAPIRCVATLRYAPTEGASLRTDRRCSAIGLCLYFIRRIVVKHQILVRSENVLFDFVVHNVQLIIVVKVIR